MIDISERRGKFILRNSFPAMANAIRRTMLSDIPKMAIDKVEFHLGPIMVDDKEYESATPLFDEVIAHRLGLIPVPTDYELFTFQDQCVCGGEGCPGCVITYSLNKHGPCTVTSGDLIPLGDDTLKVKDEFIPIVKLTDTQAVMIYCHAVMGTAKQHVKWQAVFGAGYSYMPEVTVDPDVADDPDMLKCVNVCPRNVFAIENGKLTVIDAMNCSLCNACTQDVSEGAIKISSDDTAFIFKYETDGSITARQALDKAVEILANEAKEFGEQIAAL